MSAIKERLDLEYQLIDLEADAAALAEALLECAASMEAVATGVADAHTLRQPTSTTLALARRQLR